MDNRKNNGGNKGCGRKSKAEEQKLIENLTPMNPIALKALEKALKNDDSWAVKLFFEYFYGKPMQRVDVTTNDESLNGLDYTKLSKQALKEIADLDEVKS